MTTSELIKKISKIIHYIPKKIIKTAIKEILEHIVFSLKKGKKVDIRGFGCFFINYRSTRTGRNPKTGNLLMLEEKYVPFFRAGKRLRNRINL